MANRYQKAEWFIRAVSAGEAALDAETTVKMALQMNILPNENRFCVVVKYRDEALISADAQAVVRLAQSCRLAGKHFKEYIHSYIGNQFYTVIVLTEISEKTEFVRKLKEEIEKSLGSKVQLGIGKTYTDLWKLNYSRVEAYEALLLIGEQTEISHIEDIYISRDITSQKMTQEKQYIIMLFKQGNLESVMEKVTILAEQVRMETPYRDGVPYPTSIRRTIVELLVGIMHICSDAGVDVDEELNYQDPYRRVFELTSTPDILRWFSETIDLLNRRVQEQNAKYGNNMLILARKCIAEQIQNPGLSLSLISDALKITPSYFSSFFIKEMGIGFNEYITNIRIEKAKELLKKTNQKVSWIATECGFRSSSYFIVVFRKQTGMSPGEYRRIK